MVINGFHTWQQAVPVVTLILQQLKLQKLNQKPNRLRNQRTNQVCQNQALIPLQVVRQSRQKLRFQAQSWPTMTRAWVLTMTKFWQPMVINGFHTWQQAVPAVTLILLQLRLKQVNQLRNQVSQSQAVIPLQAVRQLRQKPRFQAQNWPTMIRVWALTTIRFWQPMVTHGSHT